MTMDDKTRNRALFSEWLSGAGLILGSGVYLKSALERRRHDPHKKNFDRFALVSEINFLLFVPASSAKRIAKKLCRRLAAMFGILG